MRTHLHVRRLILYICIAVPVFDQDRLVGTWETRKASQSARAAITVVILQKADALSGNVYLADRDGSSRELTFVESSRTRKTLTFTTPMDEELFYWSLTRSKGERDGILKGSYHEMLVEEKVTKRQLSNNCQSCGVAPTVCLSDVQMAEHAVRVEMEPDRLGNHSNYHGVAVFQIRFDEKGRVTGATAISGHPLGISRLMAAVSKWRFNPVIADGVKKKACGKLSVKFVMKENVPSAEVMREPLRGEKLR